MKFAYTILYVKDVLATLSFYEQAFGFSRKMITPEQDYGELITGETTIAFASIELGNANFKNGFIESTLSKTPFGIELAFTSESIEADMDRVIQAGAMLVTEITEKPWGQKVAYVRDNNGFLIEICTPVK